MKKYAIEVSSNDAYLMKLNNKTLTTDAPIRDLKKMLPGYNVQRGNDYTWNVALWHRDPHTRKDTHLYYVVSKR